MNDTAAATTAATMSKPTNAIMIAILFGLLSAGGGLTLAPQPATPGCAPVPAATATHGSAE